MTCLYGRLLARMSPLSFYELPYGRKMLLIKAVFILILLLHAFEIYFSCFSHLKGGRHGGLMVSVLVSGSSSPGSSPGQGHCAVLLGKALYSHSASPYRGVQLNAVGLQPCSRLAFDPGRSRINPSRFMLQKLGYAPAWWTTYPV